MDNLKKRKSKKNKRSKKKGKSKRNLNFVGYGKNTTGGNNGRSYYVTNLDDKGEGSLRDILDNISKSGEPGYVKFKKGGVINSSKYIHVPPNVTIDGRTKRDHVVIKGQTLYIENSNIIVQYLIVFPGDDGKDGITIRGGENIVIDHCSTRGWTDEAIGVKTGDDYFAKTNKGITNITISNCVLTMGIKPHNFGPLILCNNSNITFYRNFFSHIKIRPKVDGNRKFPQSGVGNVEFVGNIFYDYGQSYFLYNQSTKQIIEETKLEPIIHGINLYIDQNIFKATRDDGKIIEIHNDLDNYFWGENTLIAGGVDYTIDGIKGIEDYCIFKDEIINKKYEIIQKNMFSKDNFVKSTIFDDSELDAIEVDLKSLGCNVPKNDKIDLKAFKNFSKNKTVEINSEKDI